MYTLDFTKIKPGNYNRKSSEGEDKQMLSIPSQIDEAARIAAYYKLPPYVKVFGESKSAKTEGVRPEFLKMIAMIKAGTIDSIVCWKADRLARNMTEGGIIIDLLSSGVLKAIITHDKVFYPSDNVMVLSIEFSQGKQFVKELSVNVKRGQDKKADMGIPHGVATLGFLNDRSEKKGNRKWIVDQERLSAIKILLDMFLTGTYSAGKLHLYATEHLKLRTVKREKIGGCLIAHSRIYEILTDPMYAGFFFQNERRHELSRSLPRLITEEQHERIKMLLARKNVSKTQTHETVFSGFLVSDEGNFIGQDVKYQLICDCKKKFAYRDKTHCPFCDAEIAQLSNPKYLSYTHHYNVRKKKFNIPYKSISETKITEKMVKFADENLTFSPELAEWSKKYITELQDQEAGTEIALERNKEARKIELTKKKARSREMLRDQQITPQEYEDDVRSLTKSYSDITSGDKKAVDWSSEMSEIVDLTQELKKILESGSIKARRNILSKLGSNLIWNDRELRIGNKKSIETLVKGISEIKIRFPEFEPKNYVVPQGSKEKTEPFDSAFSMMLAWQSEFRTFEWNKAFPDPDMAVRQIGQLLSLVTR